MDHPEKRATECALQPFATKPYPQTWGRYSILGFLGAGGMGSVYKAQDLRLNRIVAIKLLRADRLDASDSHQQRRFEAEARAQARIDHPHICKIYDFGIVHGQPYIAMQFIVGSPLDELQRVMSREQKLRAMKQIAEALDAAHIQGVIHRDIKPANILIERRDGGTYWPYLLDFGLARQVNSATQSSTMGIAGTPSFMSPEQARGDRHIDHRTDIYGLGAALYNVLCGRPPFSGNATEVLLDVVSKEPQPMRTFDKTIPEELDIIVLKCLEKEASRRYQTAKALAEDLERYLLGLRIVARSPSFAQRLTKFAANHKLLMASVSTAFIATLLVGGVALRARLHAAEQARLAQQLGQEIAKMEWLLHSARQVPLHNLGREKAVIRKRMQLLQTELAGYGGRSRGLAFYALGRGHLALREYPQALVALQLAIAAGNQSAEVHYALGLTLGKHFEQARFEARLSGGGDWARRQLGELSPKYLKPAISSLQRSRLAQLEAPEYLEALLAFYTGDYDASLQRAARVLAESPWMYEAAKLTGDVHHERALQARDNGRYDEAQQEFAAAVRSYQTAAASGQSDAEVYESLAETWVRQIEMQGSRGQPIDASYEAAVAVSDKILVVEPQSTAGLLKKASAAMMAASMTASGPIAAARIKQCLESAEAVLSQEPNNPYASEAAAGCYAQGAAQALAQGLSPEPLWTRALSVLEPALRRAPRFLWGLNDLGNIYGIRGAYRSLHGSPAARADLDKSLHYYQAATTLDENYVIGWQNMLGCLDELVLLSTKEEQLAALMPLVEKLFAKCQSINDKYQQCYSNYAIFYVRLARLRSASGEDPQPYLARARTKFADLTRLGGSYLDAAQHVALLYLIEANSLLRQRTDPSPVQAQMQEALRRCFALAERDVTCLTLAAQAEWVEADRLALVKQTAVPALTRAREKAVLAAQSPEDQPDAWWTLAATQLRFARAELDRPTRRDQHIREALAATDHLFAINPNHELGRQAQRELQLLAVPVSTGNGATKQARSRHPRMPKGATEDPARVRFYQR